MSNPFAKVASSVGKRARAHESHDDFFNSKAASVPTVSGACRDAVVQEAAAWRPTAGSVGGSAVSCPSVSLCVAVDGGEVLTSATPMGVAGSWKPAEVDGNNTLTGISCASVRLCVAVDASGNVVSSTDPTGSAGAWVAVQLESPSSLEPMYVACAPERLCVVGLVRSLWR